MLRTHPEIQHYTRWKTAQSIVQGETIYRTAKNSDEAQALFEEYRAELQGPPRSRVLPTQIGSGSFDPLVAIPSSRAIYRWSDVQNVLKTDATFQSDEVLKSISKLDILKAFESHVKALERSFNDKRQSQKSHESAQGAANP